MTVVPTEPTGTDVDALTFPGGVIPGQEDVEVTDLVIPRLRIDHKEGVFEDSLSNAKYPKIRCVVLGLVKQRIMWDDKVDEGDKPKCKSPDHNNGFPQMSEDVPKNKRFPWDKSNFSLEAFDPSEGLNGHVTLPCTQCIFKEWNQGDWDSPPCSEQHTYIVMFNASDDDDTPVNQYSPALITFQRTGIRPSKKYISSFAQAKQPFFVAETTIELQKLSKGSVEYSVPLFRRGEKTDSDLWKTWADQVTTVRDFVRQPPRSDDDEVEGESAATGAPTPKQPEAAKSTASTDSPSAPEDDDLPF